MLSLPPRLILAIALAILLPAASLRAQEISITDAEVKALGDSLLVQTATPTGRQATCMHLARLGPQATAATPALIEALGDEDLSRYAAEALVSIGPAAARPAAEALWGFNPIRTVAAREVLWAMGPDAKPAVPVLMKMLRGKPEQRRIAIDLIDALGPHAAAAGGMLLDLRNDEDPEIARRVESALERMDLGGADFPRPLPVSLRFVANAKDPADRPKNEPGVVRTVDELHRPTVAEAKEWLRTGDAGDALQAVRALAQRIKISREAVEGLREALSHKHRNVRVSAAIELAERGMHDERALAILREGMQRRGVGVMKSRAADVLAKVAPETPGLLDRLIEAADSPIGEVWRNGYSGINRLRRDAKAAEPVLARHLRHSNRDKREAALMQLISLRPLPKDLPDELIKLIYEARHRIGRSSVEAIRRLAEMGEEAQVATISLVVVSQRGGELERREAVRALAAIAPEDPVAVRAVMAAVVPAHFKALLLLDSESLRTALVALDALTKMALPPAEETLALLQPLLSGQVATAEHQEALTAAIVAVAARLGPAVLPHMEELVTAEQIPEWQTFAVRVLEQVALQNDQAATALVELLRRQDLLRPRIEAARAIARLPEPPAEAVPALKVMLMDESPMVRRAAIDALGALGPAAEAAVDAIDRVAQDDPANSVHAVIALVNIKPNHPSLPALFPAALSAARDEQTRTELLRKVHLIGDPAAELAPLLEKMLGDRSSEVRREAMMALGRIRPADAVVPALIRALDGSDNAIRILAVRALAEIGADAAPAAGRLSRMVDNRFVDVRRAAADALLRVSPTEQHLAAAYLAAVRHRDAQVRTLLLPHLRQAPRSIDRLLPALTKVADTDPDPQVRDDAQAALAALTPPGGDEP